MLLAYYIGYQNKISNIILDKKFPFSTTPNLENPKFIAILAGTEIIMVFNLCPDI